jgi:chromosome segregation ATPase
VYRHFFVLADLEHGLNHKIVKKSVIPFMPIYFAIILVALFFSSRSIAQQDNLSTSGLQDGLSNLKQSVEKLNLDNNQLAQRDNAVKQQIEQLQQQLKQLQARGEALNEEAASLQDKDPGRSQQIAHLEKENFDLDDRIQKSEAAIQLAQQSLDAGQAQDQRLLLQFKGMPNTLQPPSSPPEETAEDRREKEKIAIMKMINDSQEQQKSLRQAILKFQDASLAPAADPWGTRQLHRLEGELKTLEKNYLQLKDLMDKMSKKAQDADKMAVSERVEGQKLQSKIDDLKNQGTGLKKELDGLRSQMVDLDKRKSKAGTVP